MPRLLRLSEVMPLVGLKRTAIYSLIKRQAFPAPVKQGAASAWPEDEVTAYIDKLKAARPASQPTPASS